MSTRACWNPDNDRRSKMKNGFLFFLFLLAASTPSTEAVIDQITVTDMGTIAKGGEPSVGRHVVLNEAPQTNPAVLTMYVNSGVNSVDVTVDPNGFMLNPVQITVPVG